MASKVQKIEQISVDEVTFSSPRNNKNSVGKSIYVNYGKTPFRIQVPKMSCPFGVSRWPPPGKEGIPKFQLEMSFNGLKDDIYDKIKKIDEKFIKFAADNSMEMFKKDTKKELIEEHFYTSSLKPSPFGNKDEVDNKYAPRLKCKMDRLENGLFRAEVFDGVKTNGVYKKLEIDADNYDEVFPKGCSAQAIISCSGWVVDKKCGLSWRVEQLKVHRSDSSLKGYSFSDDSEDSEETSQKTADASDVEANNSDSDEKDETDQVEVVSTVQESTKEFEEMTIGGSSTKRRQRRVVA